MRLALLALLFSLFLFGCVQPSPEGNFSKISPSKPAVVEKFAIAFPSQDSLINGSSLSLQLTSTLLNEKESYFNVFLDGEKPVTINGFTYTVAGLISGRHKLRVQLLNQDRTPIKLPGGAIDSGSVKEVLFNVNNLNTASDLNEREFAIEKPEQGVAIRGPNLNVALSTKKYKVGERLFLYSIDGEINTTTKNYAYLFENLTVGKHALTVQMLYLNYSPIISVEGKIASSTINSVTFTLVK